MAFGTFGIGIIVPDFQPLGRHSLQLKGLNWRIYFQKIKPFIPHSVTILYLDRGPLTFVINLMNSVIIIKIQAPFSVFLKTH